MADIQKKVVITVDAEQAKTELNEIKETLKSTNEQVEETKKMNMAGAVNQIKSLKDGFMAGEIGVKAFAQGVLAAGKAMIVAFITNPVGIAIAAIAAALGFLVSIFKDFKPLIDKIEQSFAALSAVWNTFKSAMMGLLSGNISLSKSFNGLGGAMADAAKEAIKLKEAEQDLEDAAQDLELSNSKAQTQIQQLLLQSKNRTISEKERQDLIEKALKIENEQFLKNKEWADENERIAFNKMVQGKRVTNAELESIRNLGLAEARRILEKKGLTDEEIGLWQKALLKQQEVEREHIAISERSQGRSDVSVEKEKADNEKKVADAKATAEKLAAINKEFDDKSKAAADSLDKALKTADDNKFARKQALEKFEVSIIEDNVSRIAAEMLLLDKQHAEEIKRQEDVVRKTKAVTAERILEGDKLKQMNADYILQKKKLDDDLLKAEKEKNLRLNEEAKKAFEDKKRIDLDVFDLEIERGRRIFEEAKKLNEKISVGQGKIDKYIFTTFEDRYNERQKWLEKERDLTDKAYAQGLISQLEYDKRKAAIDQEGIKLKEERQALVYDTAAKGIADLQAIDQAATEFAINQQKAKLENGTITQEQYDRAVADIQEKAAKREKAYAVSSAIISTAQAITSALATKLPYPVPIVMAGLAGALGALQIAKILSTPTKSTSAGSSSSISSPSTSGSNGTSPNTSFSFAKNTTDIPKEPIKTFVLGKDVRTQNQMDRAIIANGSL